MNVPELITLQLVDPTSNNLGGIIVGLTVSTGQRNPRRVYFPKTGSNGSSVLHRDDFLGQFSDSTDADIMGSWGGIEDASSMVQVALYDPAPARESLAAALAWPLLPHEQEKWGSREAEYAYRISCRNEEFTADPLVADLHTTTHIELHVRTMGVVGQLAVAPDANRALLCLELYTIRRAVRAGEPQER